MTAINTAADLAIEDGVAVLTIDEPPVNALSPTVMEGLYEGVLKALADDAVKAIVLICAGRTFIAGADLKSLGKGGSKVDFFDLQARIENASKPTIAALHGTALGGGLETALTFHYRIAVPSARMGLPEVNLGLLPGGGGTQRLTRIVGAEAALDLMTTGRQVAAPEALTIGLVDTLAEEGKLREDAVAFARKLIAENRPLQRVRDLEDKVAADRARPELFDAFRKANAKRMRGLDAPAAIIRCVEAAVALPFDEAILVERKEFQGVLTGPQSAALRHLFMAERAAAKIADIPADTPVLPIKRVGVIGAGTMGGGIATALINAGYAVRIVEVKQEALDRGVANIAATLTSSVAKGRLTQEEADRRRALLEGATSLSALADCDLVIEAVFEDMALKKQIFGELDGIVRPDALLATNTSFLDVNEIAAATAHPERVLGLHFFSPANIMRLLEIVRGSATSKPAVATALALAKKLGKIGVVAGVCHGFIGNRMLRVRQAQADQMLLEGAKPWDIDRVLTQFGFPMGPYSMIDLAGLDIGWSAETSKGETVRDLLCEAGRKGQKTKGGYYDYNDNRQATPSKQTEAVIAKVAAAKGVAQRPYSDEEILDRLLMPIINEGALILEEKIAQQASDIDVAWVYGYGFPAYRGGPMFYADQLGLTKVLEKVRAIPGLEPAPLLVRLAGEGKGFAQA